MQILITEDLAQQGISKLINQGYEVKKPPIPDVGEVINGCDGIIIRSDTRITRELIEQASNLKIIGRAGIGVDYREWRSS